MKRYSPVILKKLPLGSLREDVLIPGSRFVPGRSLGGKSVDGKTLHFYDLFNQRMKNCTTRLI